MEYPRLPAGKDKRRKLTDEQIKEIRELVQAGTMSKRAIARLYDVSDGTVLYYGNGKEYQEEWKRKCRAKQLEYSADPDRKERRKQLDKEHKKRKRDLQPEFNKYQIESTKKYYSKSEEAKQMWRKRAKDWREAKKEPQKDA